MLTIPSDDAVADIADNVRAEDADTKYFWWAYADTGRQIRVTVQQTRDMVEKWWLAEAYIDRVEIDWERTNDYNTPF